MDVDNLNFKVILSDDGFDDQINKLKKKAEDFNTSMSNLLNIQKASQQWSQKDVENNRKAQQAKVDEERAQEKINREKIKTDGLQRKINAQIENATKGYKTQSRILQEMNGIVLGYLSINGAYKLLSSLVKVTGEFELQKTTLAAMLGDMNQAEQVITRIQDLAVESIFQFKDLATYAKQLSAFAVPAQELYDTTKMLADVSAGLGVGMDRIVLAYGQVRSAAFLRGQEVRQFTEAGIPILDELAKQFTELEGRVVSTGEVFDKISARLVPFEMVAKVFKDMTSEGGKFYNMQEIQAETLRGKLSNLKDAYEVMLNEIGKGQSENLKGAVDWVRRLMQDYEETGRQLAALVVSYGVYKATLIAVELATKSFNVANHKLLNTLANTGKWLANNPYALIAAGITTAAYATYRLATNLTDAERIQKSVTDSQNKYIEALSSEYAMLNALYAKLELYTEGTLEHDKAKAQIMQKYSPYIDQLRQEGIEVNNLADIYGSLAEKIQERMQVTFYESSIQDLDQEYKKAEKKAQKMLARSIKSNQRDYSMTERDKLALNLYVIGAIDQEKAFSKMGDSAKEYFKMYETFLNIQRMNMLAARNAYIEGMDDISDAYQSFQKEVEDNPIDLSMFAKTVQDTLAQFGATKDAKGKLAGLWADNTTEYYDYLDKLRKGYEEVKQKIKDVGTTQKANLPDLEKQKKAIEAIAKALDISLDKGDYGKGKSQAQIDLENQIDLVKKLQDAYDKLRPYVDDKTMKDTLAKFFPDAKQEWIDSLDFTSVIKSLADELEKYDKDAADRLRNAIGKSGIDGEIETLKELEKKYKESAKAAEEYFNLLRKWTSEDFNINGEGITLDVSKITSELSSKINEIELTATKAKELFGQIDVDSEKEVAKVKEIFVKEFGEDAWTVFWNAYYTKGTAEIDRLAIKQKEYEKKLAQEKVNDLAEKYVKESYFTENIDLTDLADKTYQQLRDLKKRLQGLLDQDSLKVPVEIEKALSKAGFNIAELAGYGELDDEFFDRIEVDYGVAIKDADRSMLRLIQQIQKAGLSTEDFGKTIKKVIGGDLKNLTEEEGKVLMNMVKSYTGEMQTLLESISGYAEAIGSDELQGAVKGISQAMDILGSVADKLAKGDWIGAIVSGVTSLASVIFEAVSAEEQLNKAIRETQREMRILASEKAILEGVESIWGTDDYKKFQNAYNEAVKAHKKATEDIQRQNDKLTGGTKDNWGWGSILTGAGAGAALGAAVGSIVPVIGTLIGALSGAVIGAVTGAIGDTATELNDYAKSLQQMADELGEELIDASTGTFNVDTLKSIKETYTDLDSASKDMIDDLIANATIYADAVTNIATYMTEIFGQCADDMADSFIESFKESGQAALEYGDIMDDVATNIAKSIIKSTNLQNVFSEEDVKEAAEKLASGDVAGAVGIVENAMEAAKELTPHIQELLESLKPYLNMEEEAGQTLGDGIKGITEDTANLLASYLNAIRADVSYAKVLWQSMDANTRSIAAALAGFSAPSLMEYQAQIAANTYNTYATTQEILYRLDSVITSEGGNGDAIRMFS